MMYHKTTIADSISIKKIRKVLCIYPSMVFDRIQSRKTAIFPLGLGYIAGILANEFEVKLLDSSLDGYNHMRNLPNGKTVYGLDDRDIKCT